MPSTKQALNKKQLLIMIFFFSLEKMTKGVRGPTEGDHTVEVNCDQVGGNNLKKWRPFSWKPWENTIVTAFTSSVSF